MTATWKVGGSGSDAHLEQFPYHHIDPGGLSPA